MKALLSVMALTIALAWPSAGEAQNRNSKSKHVQTKSQKYSPPRASARVPCERRVWWGCVGWDPDPTIRAMLARDVGGDD